LFKIHPLICLPADLPHPSACRHLLSPERRGKP
jgi:hypothetical protein